tara:strand:- start:4432 stop:4845 length:414 start_codon:yes stop_codon:yes gene_type:complete
MNLNKKMDLAVRTLNVGRSRIIFNKSRLTDIKEAITKQDIRDLKTDGAITVKQVAGRKVIVKRKNRRKAGSIRQPAINRKQKYVKLTRKLRLYLANLKAKDKVPAGTYSKLRNEIRQSKFKSLANFKEHIIQLEAKK